MIIAFITIIAWLVFIICGIFGVLAFITRINYSGSIEEKLHRIQGLKVSFRDWKFLLASLIALCWLIARYTSG